MVILGNMAFFAYFCSQIIINHTNWKYETEPADI